MGWNHDPSAIHWSHADEFKNAAEKSTPIGDDEILLEDSEDSKKKKRAKLSSLPGGASALDDLSDVDTSGVQDGDVLVYDADASTWVPGEGGGSSNASYSAKVGDASETTFEIEHSLDSSAVIVEVIEVSSGAGLVAGTDYTWSVVDDDKIEVVFSSAPGADDALVVVVASGGTSGGGGGGGGDPVPPWVSHLYVPDDTPVEAVEFNGASGFTKVVPTGTATEVETRSLLVVEVASASSGDRNGWMYPLADPIPIGGWVETAFRTIGNADGLVGVVISDGVTATDNMVQSTLFIGGSSTVQRRDTGTFTAASGANSGSITRFIVASPLYIRLIRTADNEWRSDISPDGVSWISFIAAFAATITPTHFGVTATSTSASGLKAAFDYVRVYH